MKGHPRRFCCGKLSVAFRSAKAAWINRDFRGAKGDHRAVRRGTPAGFTLVEMLTVMAIIGILAAILAGAIFAVLGRGRVAATVMEIKGLETALKTYQADVGEFPPDFTDQNAVMTHISRRWPRYVPGSVKNSSNPSAAGSTPWARFVADLSIAYSSGGRGINPGSITPSKAMVFWLGGPAYDAANSTYKFVGFSANPTNPFALTACQAPQFEFDTSRINNTNLEYRPASSSTTTTPYVYFRAYGGSGGYSTNQFWTSYGKEPTDATGTLSGASIVVRPYRDSRTTTSNNIGSMTYFCPTSFQIISAGADGYYGGSDEKNKSGPGFPSGVNYSGIGHFDNVTNFTSGGTIDDLPKN